MKHFSQEPARSLFHDSLLICLILTLFLTAGLTLIYLFFPDASPIKSPLFVLLAFLQMLLLLYSCIRLTGLRKALKKMNRLTAELVEEIDKMVPHASEAMRSPRETESTIEQMEYLLRHYAELVSQEHSKELLNRQIQLKELQDQINPHFLYNALEAIRGNALATGAVECAGMAQALAHFFRYSITTTGAFVSLADEVENVKNYFFIQQYRFGDRFNLKIECDEGLDLTQHLIPKLSLQPIVENSIYHGLEPKIGAGTVTLRITQSLCHILISIRDNGVGISAERLYQIKGALANCVPSDDTGTSPGVALYNVNRRFQLAFGAEHGLILNSAIGEGTEVEFFIPLTSIVQNTAAGILREGSRED